MVKWSAFLLVVLSFAAVHEGAHALVAAAFGEYEGFRVRPFGLEVVFKTPVEQRLGSRWALISGGANLLTVVLGYSLFSARRRLCSIKTNFWRLYTFYAVVLFLFLDPLNLAFGPFLYGGDAIGIAGGLNTSQSVLQAISFVVFLVNRELVATCVAPLFGVKRTHFLLRPIVKPKMN
ncbi:MAG: hypothetical protein ONB12_00235 [candidate division KSB1 bacterium]|nr:hypothetical protein [candidate division KSB1 bacterium]